MEPYTPPYGLLKGFYHQTYHFFLFSSLFHFLFNLNTKKVIKPANNHHIYSNTTSRSEEIKTPNSFHNQGNKKGSWISTSFGWNLARFGFGLMEPYQSLKVDGVDWKEKRWRRLEGERRGRNLLEGEEKIYPSFNKVIGSLGVDWLLKWVVAKWPSLPTHCWCMWRHYSRARWLNFQPHNSSLHRWNLVVLVPTI